MVLSHVRAGQARKVVDLSEGALDGFCGKRLPDRRSVDGQGIAYLLPAIRDQSRRDGVVRREGLDRVIG